LRTEQAQTWLFTQCVPSMCVPSLHECCYVDLLGVAKYCGSFVFVRFWVHILVQRLVILMKDFFLAVSQAPVGWVVSELLARWIVEP